MGHVTMLNACTEAHAFAPLRFAHAVEMWHFGSLASRSLIRQAGTRTGIIRANFVHIFSLFGIPLGLSFLNCIWKANDQDRVAKIRLTIGNFTIKTLTNKGLNRWVNLIKL